MASLRKVALQAAAVVAALGLAMAGYAASGDQAPSTPPDQADRKAPPAGDGQREAAKTEDSSQSAAERASKLTNRELVQRRLALCRQRPEICQQKGEKKEEEGKQR
jgi:hypothetical protein